MGDIYTERDVTIRMYDSTGTPYYLTLTYDKGFGGPLGIPAVEEVLKLDRNAMDGNAHYIKGSDSKIMDPVDVNFAVELEDTTITTYLLDWLQGETVNGKTIVTTKGDTQRNGANANPAFADTGKLCCNVEVKFAGSVDIVVHYNEVWFPLAEQKIAEALEGSSLTLVGKCFGTIVVDTAFTAGTDVTA